jgi:hypothetical protein
MSKHQHKPEVEQPSNLVEYNIQNAIERLRGVNDERARRALAELEKPAQPLPT